MTYKERLEKLQGLIEKESFEEAELLLTEIKAQDFEYSEMLAILEGTLCAILGQKEASFEAICKGLQLNPFNYELYFMLGGYYLQENINKAFLCYENALFHYVKAKKSACPDERDYSQKIEVNDDYVLLKETVETLKQNVLMEVKPVAVVVVSYNGCYFMQKNIESIRENNLEESYSIVVVDNASDDGVREWLREQKDITLITNTENVGFPKGCNQGVNATIGSEAEEYDVFLLNNDTRLAPNALFWLRMGLYENDRIGATGSMSNYAGNNQQMELNFELPKDYIEYGIKNNVPMLHPYEERIRLSGFAMLIKRDVWNRTGGMNELFSPGYFEDDDLSMRISKMGYKLMVCKNSFIYHAGSQSFSKKRDIEQLLLNHYQMFVDQYGFQILEYAYGEESYLKQIPFEVNTGFNVLHIGSRLGATLKMIRSKYKNANVIGIEKDENMYAISRGTEVVFRSVSELRNLLGSGVFQIVIAEKKEILALTAEERTDLQYLCSKDCKLISKKEDYSNLDFGKIKLVIWDMDDTFWKGTISEGSITTIDGNIDLVKQLCDRGIVNSISSKNDEEPVKYVLKKLAIDNLFVFNHINWHNKGEQIRDKIQKMNLRAENVLFIDDNVRNLEEAVYFNEGLMVAEPEIIPVLQQYMLEKEESDLDHKRLKQYQLLEEKNQMESAFDSKEQFLYYSNIKVSLHQDADSQLERISEMVQRTNQLNFTKLRSSKEELAELFCDRNIKCGYIKVSDRFGDYGIVGFYAYDQVKDCLVHFLFSCRIIGMGVEQFVYTLLGSPEIEIAEPVASGLVRFKRIPWIRLMEETNHGMKQKNTETSQVNDDSIQENNGLIQTNQNWEEIVYGKKDERPRILLKGPCDMSAIEGYLSDENLETEFNYVNEQGFITTGQNHSMHIWQNKHLSEKEIKTITEQVPFIVEGDFATNLYRKEYRMICYSLLPDCHAGLYRNKETGAYISFGSRNFDLTDEKNWQGYIDGTIVNHLFPFDKNILKQFKEKWEFVGATSEKDLLRNLEDIYQNVKGKPIIVLLLGSEIAYEGENGEFANHEKHHQKMNTVVKNFAKDKERIVLIETTDYIHSQMDYEDCINHFSRSVYYEIANKILNILNDWTI